MAACDKVLATFELVEQIILELPLRQLLLCQRVNKAFFDVVNTSHDIQRALFLKPTANTRKEVETLDSMSPPCYRSVANPFIKACRVTKRTARTARKAVYDQGSLYSLGLAWHELTCLRGETNAPRGTNSRDSMLLASAPAAKYRLCHKKDPAIDVDIGTDAGTTYGNLIECCNSLSKTTPVDPRWPLFDNYFVVGSREWMLLKGTIDTITGQMMLTTLDMNVGESNDETFVAIERELGDQDCGWHLRKHDESDHELEY